MSRIVELVRKLMAKASDPSVTEAEAALFAEKAQRILADHGLSMADVPEEERDDHVAKEEWAAEYAGDAWRRSIASRAAKLYMCEMITTDVLATVTARTTKFRYDWSTASWRTVKAGETYQDYRKGYIIVGRPHNTAVCREMCQYLFDTTVRLARQYSTTRPEQLAFMRGCGERIATRLWTLYHEQTTKKRNDERNQKSGPSGLPALYTAEDALIKKFIEAEMSVRYSRRPGSSTDGEHAGAGARAGDSVSLAPQVSGSSGARLLS